jgi:hypothetical protein
VTDERRQPGDIHVSGSQGVIVGSGTQHNHWSLIGLPPKVVFSGMAFLAVLIGVVLYLKPWAASPAVKLADYLVGSPTETNGKDFEIGSMGNGPVKRTDVGTSKVPVTPVDITLKNDGAASAVVTDAVVTVVFAEYLEDCAATGGSLNVEADYQVRLPLNPPKRPFTVHQPMHFEVRPHRSERFTLTIGPETQGSESWDARLYVADVSLKMDYDDELVRVGPAGWVTRSGDGYHNLDMGIQGSQACLRKNAERMARFGAVAATRSDEATTLIKRWSRLTAPGGAVRQPTCWTPPGAGPAAGLPSFCALYTRGLLLASVSLHDAPATDQLLVLRVSGTDGRLRQAAICRTGSQSGAVREVPLFTPGTELTTFDQCSDGAQDDFHLYAYPDHPLTDDQLLISVQLLPVGERISDVGALPASDGTGLLLAHRAD